MNGIRTAGALHVVGTPIGNLTDLSARAADVLGQVDVIAAEDTRRTRRLLSPIRQQTRLIAYHEHNEKAVTPQLVELLESGLSVALVSDAGMPLISDPGWRLVHTARERGIEVLSVPGPSAVTAALSVAGLPSDRFAFEGFLPRRAGQRSARLAALATEARSMVFFEAVHRLEATLAAMIEHFGADRPAAIARELTKLHEETTSGTLGALESLLGRAIALKGEFVVVVAGATLAPDEAEVSRIYALAARELAPDRAVALASAITGVPRNRVYALVRR